MSNVPCYSVSSIIRDLSVASGVSLIRMLGNFETKSFALLLRFLHHCLFITHIRNEKIVMKIIFIHFLVNAIQK